jgi:hypothetical protein
VRMRPLPRLPPVCAAPPQLTSISPPCSVGRGICELDLRAACDGICELPPCSASVACDGICELEFAMEATRQNNNVDFRIS